jgi:lauroyl/myristoyl acyltransferase
MLWMAEEWTQPRSLAEPSIPPYLGLERPVRRAANLRQALLWTAKKLAYTLLPPRLLCLIMYAKGFLRFCADGGTRRRLAQGYSRAWRRARNRAELMRIVHNATQLAASKHFTYKVLPQRLRPRDLFDIKGLHHLDAALSQGRGVIMVTGHIGYPFMIEIVLGKLGYTSQRITNAPLEQERFFAEEDVSRWPWLHAISRRLMSYARLGEPIVTSQSLRPIFELLERNQILVLAADGTAASRLLVAPVLGAGKVFGPGAFKLARKGDVPLLPTFVLRGQMQAPRMTLLIHPPMRVRHSSDAGADLQENVAEFARILEGHVARYPHLYEQFEPDRVARISSISLEDRYAGRTQART